MRLENKDVTMTLPAQVKAADDRANEAIANMQPKAAEQEPQAPIAPVDTWETKYKVLQGKYNAEVPRMAAQIRELQSENETLKAKVSEAQTKIEPETSADAELFDPDLVALIRQESAKAAREQVDPFRPAFEGQRAKDEAEARIASEQGQQDRFLSALSSVHPDWQQVDGSAEFKRFLIGTDARTGKVRQQVLEDSLKRFDPTDAILIFTEFKRALSSSPSGLAAQVTPAVAGAGASVTDGSTKVWTRKEIAAFYSDVTRGKYTRNPQEAAAIEADIEKAQKEGRIRG
jgi:hypothetical protein